MNSEPSDSRLEHLRAIIGNLILLQKQLRLYGPGHTTVRNATLRLMNYLPPLFDRADTIDIFVARHAFMYDDGFIDRSSKAFEAFANQLFHHGVAALSLHRGIGSAAVQTFLQLTARRPAETWDEGGIAACLASRGVTGLSVREMSEHDFILDDQTAGHDNEQEPSPLWERFAHAVQHSLHLGETAGNCPPRLLAEITNTSLSNPGQETVGEFIRNLGRFLLSLQHESVKPFRQAMAGNLADYIAALSRNLRREFFHSLVKLNLDPELATAFFSGLTDQAIMDALADASAPDSGTPPVMLRLLGALASRRGLTAITPQRGSDLSAQLPDRIRTLLKPDLFDTYVPKQYQSVLLKLVETGSLPMETTEHLESLKSTLEPAGISRHMGDMLSMLLQDVPDENQLAGLRQNILEALKYYLNSREFDTMLALIAQVTAQGAGKEIVTDVNNFVASEKFTGTVLDIIPTLPRDEADAAWRLITTLGRFFVEPLLERLGSEPNRALRRTYLQALIAMGELCLPHAIRRLNDSRWFVTRNMLFLLRELGNPLACPAIRTHLQNSHPKVRREALAAALTLRDETALPLLLQSLQSRDALELHGAVGLAGIWPHPQVIERLITLLREGALLDFRLQVRRAAARSLAAAAPEAALATFARILTAHSLLHGRALEQLKGEIVSILANLPGAEANRLLTSVASSDHSGTGDAARSALARRKGGTP